MKINKINFGFVLYLALIEGFALITLDLMPNNLFGWFLVGFIPAILTIFTYKINLKWLPIKINDKKLEKIPLLLSIANGIFIVLLFLIQELILFLFDKGVFIAILGFFSVFLTFLLMLLVYNAQPFKLNVEINKKKIKLNKVNWKFSVYAGIFEFFILPLMVAFYVFNINSFLNGLISGLIGGFLALLIVNFILKNNPLKIE